MNAAAVLLGGMIRAYQLLLAPVLGSNCRFSPSCSAYAREAIELHGAMRGGILAVRRLIRCNPWGPGGYDPVPCHGGADHGRPMDGVTSPVPADSATGFRE